jgi:hypothetical protein
MSRESGQLQLLALGLPLPGHLLSLVLTFKVTGHPFWRFAENRYCALKISPIFINFSPNVSQCMQNMIKL